MTESLHKHESAMYVKNDPPWRSEVIQNKKARSPTRLTHGKKAFVCLEIPAFKVIVVSITCTIPHR